MSILSEPHFHCEEAAYERLEAIVWPNGPICPHCGGTDRITVVGGKTARPGLKRCLQCKLQFRATVGTVFESSHIKLHLWFQAAHLLASSKKGISSHQLHRTLKVTYKTAWFMAHRLREAMRDGHFSPMGGEGEIVEIDETFVGGKEKNKHANKRLHLGTGGVGKEAVLTLVERGGKARSRLAVLLAESYEDFGTIDGRVQVISDEGDLHVFISEPIGSRRVRCFFEEDMLPRFLTAFRKRVEVKGKIKYRRDHKPISIFATALKEYPASKHLPSYREMRGIFRE